MSDIDAALDELRRELAVIADLGSAGDLAAWDQRTYLPPAGQAGRSDVLATLARLRHERIVDDHLHDRLCELSRAPLQGDDAALVREALRDVEIARRQPTELVVRMARQFSRAEHRWAEARAADDFTPFAPELRENLVLLRERAAALAPDRQPYDALHDLYERGSSGEAVERVFTPLRTDLVELAAAIRDSDRTVTAAPFLGDFDERAQERFALEMITAFGFDTDAGRLDRTTHPFASGIAPGDVRITTRYVAGDMRPSLFATMHEAGHGIYEQNLPHRHARTPLGGSVSLGVHESQSRLWENLIGRSRPFWGWAFPKLRAAFPGRFDDVSVDDVYAAANVVEPSLIRVEADEVTYHLHVMVRFELERALLAGDLAVDDLPVAWNERYDAYLGITPPGDARGCLQDVHWSAGLLGYFPTYTLGTLLSVQLWEAMGRDLGDVDAAMREGDFRPVLEWMVEHVHAQGRRFTPAELTERATGAPLSAEPYLRYVRAKFGRLYGLEGQDRTAAATA